MDTMDKEIKLKLLEELSNLMDQEQAKGLKPLAMKVDVMSGKPGMPEEGSDEEESSESPMEEMLEDKGSDEKGMSDEAMDHAQNMLSDDDKDKLLELYKALK